MKFNDSKIVIAKCPACQATTKVTLEPGRAAIHCPRCKRQLPLAYAQSYQSETKGSLKESAPAGEADVSASMERRAAIGKKRKPPPTGSTEVEYAALHRTFTHIAFLVGSGIVVVGIILLVYSLWHTPVDASNQEYLKNIREAVSTHAEAIQVLEDLHLTQDQASKEKSQRRYRELKGEIDFLAQQRRHLTEPQESMSPEFEKLLEELKANEKRLAVLEVDAGLKEIASSTAKNVPSELEPKPTEPVASKETKPTTPNAAAQQIPKNTDPSTLLVILPGVTANQVNDIFLKRFSQLTDQTPGQVRQKWAGDLLTLEVKPVANPAIYAAKIDFGKLVYLSLSDRSITLQLDAERVANVPNLASDPLTPLLADLKQRDKISRLLPALNRLGEIKPDHRQAEVTAVLVTVINDRLADATLREQAIKLLPAWAGPDAVGLFEKWMEDSSALIRSAALRGLVEIRAVGSAPTIVKNWNKLDPERVAQALITLGPAVEPHVLPFLNNTNDQAVRIQACKVLKEIGTTQALKPLLDVINGADQPAVVVNAAKEAMQGILTRDTSK